MERIGFKSIGDAVQVAGYKSFKNGTGGSINRALVTRKNGRHLLWAGSNAISMGLGVSNGVWEMLGWSYEMKRVSLLQLR